jgi:hypothetical protein
LFRCLDRLILHPGLFLQDPQRRQIVFHFLEPREYGLAISGHIGIIRRSGLIGLRAPQTALEHGL